MSPVPVPPFDPMGLPAQDVVLLGLSYFTLTLHLVAMGFTVGSLVLLLWTLARRRAAHAGLRRFLGSGLPLGFSYLITLGVPPLLFVQVLYGPFFYSSSVLVGAFWILVIPLLILAYGLSYAHRLLRDGPVSGALRVQGPMVTVSLVCALAVGFIYVNNITLSQRPELWMSHYVAHPGGAALNLGEPGLYARCLLFLSQGLPVAGLALIMRGGVLLGWGRGEDGRASQQLGRRAFLVGVVLVAVGLLGVYRALPAGAARIFSGTGAAAMVAWVGAALALLAAVPAWLSHGRAGLRLPLLAAVSWLFAVACLVVVRDQVRREVLRPHLDLSDVTVRVQWPLLVGFGVALVAGLAFVVVLTVAVVRRAAQDKRRRLG